MDLGHWQTGLALFLGGDWCSRRFIADAADVIEASEAGEPRVRVHGPSVSRAPPAVAVGVGE